MDGYSNFAQTKVVPTSVNSFGPEYRQLHASDSDIYFTGTFNIDVDVDFPKTSSLFIKVYFCIVAILVWP